MKLNSDIIKCINLELQHVPVFRYMHVKEEPSGINTLSIEYNANQLASCDVDELLQILADEVVRIKDDFTNAR